MSDWTTETQKRLNKRFSRKSDGSYYAHEPIYGPGGFSSPYQIQRLARVFSILRAVNQMDFATALDVGAAEGFLGTNISRLFSAAVYTIDLSVEANRRTQELFRLTSITATANGLPFADGTFDLVTCSEVLEHLEFPFDALAELQRVAKKYLLITTNECYDSEHERSVYLKLRNMNHLHEERNHWIPADFLNILGKDILLSNSNVRAFIRSNELETQERIRRAIRRLGSLPLDGSFSRRGQGVRLVKVLNDATLGPPRLDDNFILESMISNFLEPREVLQLSGTDESEHMFDDSLLNILACPVCLQRVTRSVRALVCEQCRREYPIEYGIPNFYLGQATRIARHREIRSEHISALAAKFSAANIARSTLEWFLFKAILSMYRIMNLLVGQGTALSKMHEIKLYLSRRQKQKAYEGEGEMLTQTTSGPAAG